MYPKALCGGADHLIHQPFHTYLQLLVRAEGHLVPYWGQMAPVTKLTLGSTILVPFPPAPSAMRLSL